MWFHAKKLLKTLKFWKSLNSLCKSGSRPQKSPKKAQKTDHSIAIYSNFWIGMVYFGYHLVNPQWGFTRWYPKFLMSRGFRICMAKWSRGCLRPTYNQPKLTLSSRFVATQLWCCKSKTLRQFSSERSAIIQTWTPKWWLQVQLIADLSDEDWQSVFDL